MHRHILNCCRKRHTNYRCQYHVMGMQGESIIANLVHSIVALLWFWHGASLIRRQHFMAGPGFSEACRGRRMWITAQCSSTVLSRWLHLFWQALDCVWWWETAPGWRSAPALQLTMWIMETPRSKSMHQQTPTPINPSLKGSTAETPDVPQSRSHALQTLVETRWGQRTQVLRWALFQHPKFLCHLYIRNSSVYFSLCWINKWWNWKYSTLTSFCLHITWFPLLYFHPCQIVRIIFLSLVFH